VAYAEIGNLALDLAAYRARLSDPAWPGAGLWRPANASTARQRRVSLHLIAGLGSLALAAEFLHPGADRREVISSAGSVHGASSRSIDRVLVALLGQRPGATGS
jgi:hypothetical protein